MYRWTAFFLILLRLAIGWHFLVEGFLKVRTNHLVGKTATSDRLFSSAGYLGAAPGPLGTALRHYEGDPDDHALARLVVPPLGDDEDPATARPADRVSGGLSADWDDYLRRFTEHYTLSSEQADKARGKLRQAKSDVVTWLTYVPPADPARRAADKNYAAMTTEQTRTFPTGEVKRRMSMAERVAEYRAKVAELRDPHREQFWAFSKQDEGPQLKARVAEAALKAEVAKLRKGLMSDLDKQTGKLQADLDGLLTPEQKEMGPVKAATPFPIIQWIDLVTPWMLCATGVGLLLGLFSRLWAVVGAVFLFMTYLAVPAWPWLPLLPMSEGNYLFVNKNLIEMLALCALACAPTGRWFGLDAIVYALWPRRAAPQPRLPLVVKAGASRAERI